MKIEEQIAKAFHEAYESLAATYGYTTRKNSSVPWEDVPTQNKDLMIATVIHLLNEGTIQAVTNFFEDEET